MNWKAPVLQISRSQHARRVYAALSGTPILGGFLRRLVRGVVPVETHVWLRISGGLGNGLWDHLDARFEMDYASGKYEPPIQQRSPSTWSRALSSMMLVRMSGLSAYQ